MEAPEPQATPAARLPEPRDFLNSLALVTRLPIPAPPISGSDFAHASLFFPLIGFAVGMLLMACWRTVLAELPPAATGALLAVLWELLGVPTGEPGDRRRGWPSLPATGGLLLSGLVKGSILGGLGPLLAPALLFVPTLGRWSLVVLAVGARSASRTGKKFSPAVTFREFGVASLMCFALVFTLGQLIGLILIVTSGATTLVLRLAFHRWQGGVTWATVVAGTHAIEICALSVLAAMIR